MSMTSWKCLKQKCHLKTYQKSLVYQLTKNLTVEEAKTAGFDAYYIDHAKGIWPQAASSLPFTSIEFQSKGDVFADLHEDLAAEQKARATYDNLLRMIKDPEVREPLKFLRAREIVHFQRFGEAIEMTKKELDSNRLSTILYKIKWLSPHQLPKNSKSTKWLHPLCAFVVSFPL